MENDAPVGFGAPTNAGASLTASSSNRLGSPREKQDGGER